MRLALPGFLIHNCCKWIFTLTCLLFLAGFAAGQDTDGSDAANPDSAEKNVDAQFAQVDPATDHTDRHVQFGTFSGCSSRYGRRQFKGFDEIQST